MAVKYYNASLKNLIYRLRKYKEILKEELFSVIELHADEITDTIREQMWAGIDGYLDEIKPSYTARTRKNKARKNQPTDRVTLKDTGKFYKSFEVKIVDNEGFTIISADIKANKLIEKYGPAIFRMSDKNFTKIVRGYIRPELEKRMKEYLLKK